MELTEQSGPHVSGDKKCLFIFGFGFTSHTVAERLQDRFDRIFGTTRSAEKAEKLSGQGVEPVLFGEGVRDPRLMEYLANATHILVSIGPNEEGDPVLRELESVLKGMPGLEWIGYLSTVGVYGNHDGAWVDEATPTKPASKRSVQRVKAENSWQAFAGDRGLPLAIFRLSGIYGPGRNAFVNMEKGKSRRLIKPGQVFNRVHREDIAEAVSKAIDLQASGIFNISDDEPAPPQAVVTYAHQLAGRKPPEEVSFETADLTPMARSFYGENKRVSNARSKTILGMEYRWPDYRTSLERMWKEGSWMP